MNPDLVAFLHHQKANAEDDVTWDNGRLQFHVTSYLSQEEPSSAHMTSVRALVTKGDDILVVRDPEMVHILPGGRREPGETLLQTLQREVLEETGWTLGSVKRLGFLHFHHLGPKPPDYAYAYPDFFQAVYWARALDYRADARQVDGYELEAVFQPMARVKDLGLTPGEHCFLDEVMDLLQHGNKMR